VASRGIEPRIRGFSVQDNVIFISWVVRRNVTSFLPFSPCPFGLTEPVTEPNWPIAVSPGRCIEQAQCLAYATTDPRTTLVCLPPNSAELAVFWERLFSPVATGGLVETAVSDAADADGGFNMTSGSCRPGAVSANARKMALRMVRSSLSCRHSLRPSLRRHVATASILNPFERSMSKRPHALIQLNCISKFA
jgi:hypothetical protein